MKFLLIALCLCSVLCTSEQYRKAMNDLVNHNFGNTLIETIQMHISSDEPIGNLIDMFQELDKKIQKLQLKADDAYERIDNKCRNDQSKLSDTINVLKVKQVTLKSEIDTLSPQIKASVATVERKKKEIQDFKTELTLSQDQRNKENQTYLEILDNLEQALSGFTAVRTNINRFIDQIQKGLREFESFSEIQKDIKHMRHQTKLEGFKYFLAILAQLTTGEIEQEDALKLAQKLTAIIKQIESYIQNERIREDTAETSRVEAYDQYKTMIAQQLIDAQNDYTEMDGILQSQSTNLKTSELEKQEVDIKLKNKQSEQDDITNECLSSRQEYEVQSRQRQQQRDLIDQAILLTTTSLGQLKADLLKHASNE